MQETKKQKEIRRRAERKVRAKKGFYITGTVYLSVAVILFVLSLTFSLNTAFWVLFPIIPLAVALFIHYVAVFGFPGSEIGSRDWEVDEVDNELRRLYARGDYNIEEDEELSNNDKLELRELERLKQKWEGDEIDGTI